MAVTITGMIGADKTYFAYDPVVIIINNLVFPADSPVKVCRIAVMYQSVKVGEFSKEIVNESVAEFNISSALRNIWSDYTYFTDELAAAAGSLGTSGTVHSAMRASRPYTIQVFTGYIIDGQYTETSSPVYNAGSCVMGGRTEWERSLIDNIDNADISALEHTGVRYGDASTKPTSSPERVGRDSITSWVDFANTSQEQVSVVTKSIFYPASAPQEPDDRPSSGTGWAGHAPIVLRDNIPYADFLFVNRFGAVETCSALPKESMELSVSQNRYSRTEGPSYAPVRPLMAIGGDGRRSWNMSSGYVTREWAEWWTLDFLSGKYKQWWMLYHGRYVPVVVTPAKTKISIYDRAKQSMPHVDFDVELGYEG